MVVAPRSHGDLGSWAPRPAASGYTARPRYTTPANRLDCWDSASHGWAVDATASARPVNAHAEMVSRHRVTPASTPASACGVAMSGLCIDLGHDVVGDVEVGVDVL